MQPPLWGIAEKSPGTYTQSWRREGVKGHASCSPPGSSQSCRSVPASMLTHFLLLKIQPQLVTLLVILLDTFMPTGGSGPGFLFWVQEK